jgi:membrane protein implicated in regulation of membrane protease activity
MRRLQDAPLWLLCAVIFVVSAVMWAALVPLVTPIDSAVAIGVSAVFYSAVMTAFLGVRTARARRRAGGARELRRIHEAVRRGDVRSDIDTSTWIEALDAQHRELRRNLWFGPVVFSASIVLGSWLALTQTPLWWAAVGFFLAVLVVSVVTTPRSLARVARIRDDVERRSQFTGGLS